MAHTRGPLDSLRASGQLSKALTYTHSRGRNAIKRYHAPADRRTPKQLAVRALMTWLQTRYNLDPGSHVYWDAHGASSRLSGYHAYLQVNSLRWWRGQAPAMDYPATMAPPTPDLPTLFVATAQDRQVYLQFANLGVPGGWAWAVYRSTTGPCAPLPTELRLMYSHIIGPTSLYDPADPNTTYWYAIRDIAPTGRWSEPLHVSPVTTDP